MRGKTPLTGVRCACLNWDQAKPLDSAAVQVFSTLCFQHIGPTQLCGSRTRSGQRCENSSRCQLQVTCLP